MSETFQPNVTDSEQAANPEKIRLDDVDGTTKEWGVSHTDSETGMVFLKHQYGEESENKFIYRGMSRARFAELGGELASEQVAEQKPADAQLRSESVPPQPDLSGTKFEGLHRPYTTPEAWQLLSYADIYGSNAANSEFMKTDHRAIRYTARLMVLSVRKGREAIEQLSDEVRADYQSVMDNYPNVDAGKNSVAKSVSWSMWDIAKQSAMAKDPKLSNSNYKLADPFDPVHRAEKVREMGSRHVGYEFWASSLGKGTTKEYVAQHAPENIRDELVILLEMRNDRGRVPSYALTKIGELLRSEIEK